MPNYRRYRQDGGTFFFTVKTEGNSPLFADEECVHQLGETLRQTQSRWPFVIHALVLLPDHLHTLWGLPQGDHDYSKRWAWLKKEFTRWYVSQGRLE